MPTFDTDEVDKLIRDLGYLQIAKQKGAKVFLLRLVRDATELQGVLGQYPAVRYAPLDYHYLLLKYLAVLSPDLVADLCSRRHGWRGVVVAAWLSCMRPSPLLAEPLATCQQRTPEPNRWLVELAMSQVGATGWSGDPEILDLLQSLRQSLAPLPLPRFSLNRFPAPAQLGRMRAERLLVRHAYRAGGLSAAQAAVRGTLLERRGAQ
jgi:hypothetical protein